MTRAELVGFLDDAVLREFFTGWAELVQVVSGIRASSRGGALLQYPKIPSSVSEALAARILLRERHYPDASHMIRGGGADIRVRTPADMHLVEVKGSGSSEFQTFGRKDYDCALLVWLRFGDALQMHLDGVLRATFFPFPKHCLGDLGSRVTYATAEASVRDGCAVKRLDVRLSDLLSADTPG